MSLPVSHVLHHSVQGWSEPCSGCVALVVCCLPVTRVEVVGCLYLRVVLSLTS